MKRRLVDEHLYRKITWKDISPLFLKELIQRAHNEDLLGEGLAERPKYLGDLTSSFLGNKNGRARLVAREALVLCGTHLIPLILKCYGDDLLFEAQAEDGDTRLPGETLGEVSGAVDSLLKAERVILNFIQYLSGIATLTRSFLGALGVSKTKLLDTRKTTPGYRLLEKYAVACAGGWNHRLGLFDRILFKDNHWASGKSGSDYSLTTLVQMYRDRYPDIPVEVEVDHVDQVREVVDADVDVILLDNFSLENLHVALNEIDGNVLTEASGNISLTTLPSLGRLGLDFISCGAITHQSKWVDIGMDWIE